MMFSLHAVAETVLVCLFCGFMFLRVGEFGRWRGPFGWCRWLVLGAGDENIGRALR